MMNELVTVVVPVYNVEKYLDRCVTSIAAQTYTNLEIILVDDGSPDSCPQMCDEWAKKDARVKVVHKPNAGLGMARNTGIENATGAYICFFDSDDYIAADTVEKAYSKAVEKQADVVVFGLSKVNRHGNVIRQLPPKTESDCFFDDQVQNSFLPDLIDSQNRYSRNENLALSACVCLFSMALIRATGWRFVSEREMISEDSYALIWLYKYVTRVAVLPEALYYYCDNEMSLTRTYRADRFEKVKQFYIACSDMAAQQGYGELVRSRIAGLCLSFTIAAIKQIAAAEQLARKQKIEMLQAITADPLIQQILSDPQCLYSSVTRKILLWVMKKQWNEAVLMLAKLQVRKDAGE